MIFQFIVNCGRWTFLHRHDQKLGHNVGGNDLDGENACDPGSLKQPLGPLSDEGLRRESHGQEEDPTAYHAWSDELPVVRVLGPQQRVRDGEHLEVDAAHREVLLAQPGHVDNQLIHGVGDGLLHKQAQLRVGGVQGNVYSLVCCHICVVLLV